MNVIKGLDSLINLKRLDLGYNSISKISRLANLYNLEVLYLIGNQIEHNLIEELGGLDSMGRANEPQNFVESCRRNR